METCKRTTCCSGLNVQVCSRPHLSVDVAQRSQQAGGAVRRAAGRLNALQQLLQRRLQLLLLRRHSDRLTVVVKRAESLKHRR